MVTLKMLAEETGLSIAAVSKALNHQPGVSAKNAERVREAARRMNYFPNGAAQTLKTSRSYNIGIVYQNNLDHEYFSRMLSAVRIACDRAGYDLTFLSSRGIADYGYAAHAMRRNCDGVIVMQGNIDQDDLERLGQGPLPVVSVDRAFEGRTSVWSENTSSMGEIVEYVASRGHTRIAFVHGEVGEVTAERIAAFKSACSARGIAIPEEYLYEAKFQEPELTAQAVRELMNLPEPPTCILFPDDISATGGLSELEREGVSVPGDVSCFGYDGVRMASLLHPRLTTYRQDAEEIGTKAAEELFRAIEQGKSYKPLKIVIPGAIQEGNTVRDISAR